MVKVPASVQKKYKKVINEVVEDLSDTIKVISPPSTVKCPNCYWDSTNKRSSGVYDTSFTSPTTVFEGTSCEREISPSSFTRGRCPVCYNEGVLTCDSISYIKGLFDFFPSVSSDGETGLAYQPYGRDGKTYSQLTAHEKYYNLLLNCIYVECRGVKYTNVYPPLLSGVGIDAVVNCFLVPLETDSRIRNE